MYIHMHELIQYICNCLYTDKNIAFTALVTSNMYDL